MKAQCVTGCGRPARSSALCRECADQLEKDISEIPGLGDDLETARARQSVMGERVGSASSEKPVPWDDRASKAIHAARAQLVEVVKLVGPRPEPRLRGGPACERTLDGCGHESCRVYRHVTSGWPRADIRGMGEWLLTHFAEIRRSGNAALIVGRVRDVLHDGRWVVDRPADRWYAGPCSECAADMYPKHGADVVRCQACGFEHDTQTRQAWLLAEAKDTLAHAELIGRALAVLGVETTPAAIRNYADRGRLVPHGKDQQNRPLYRLGDAIDVATEAASRRAARDARRDSAAVARRSA